MTNVKRIIGTRGLGKGREKIFEVRQIHNDLTFIDEFLTLDFCRRHKLFQFGFNEDSGYYEIESRAFDKVKKQLLFSLTNRGQPIIYVREGNYKNRGELFLEHRFNGPELKIEYAKATLESLQRLWRRPVHIETNLEGSRSVISFDGKNHVVKNSGEPMDAELDEAFEERAMNDTCSLKNLSSGIGFSVGCPEPGSAWRSWRPESSTELRGSCVAGLRCVEQLACEVESIHLTLERRGNASTSG